MNKLSCYFLVSILAAGFHINLHAEADVEYYRSDLFKQKNLPLSDVVRVDNLLFVSGNLGIDFSTENLALVPGGITAETRQTLKNIDRTLKNYGSSLDKVVKCTLFLADIDEWPAVNKVWREFFKQRYPARTAVQAGRLWHDAAIEIECIAATGK